MMASCLSVLGMVIQVSALVTAAVSLFTPFWIENESSDDFHAGLWQNCTGRTCHWIEQGDIEGWFSAIRIIHTVATANALVALVVAMSYLCCSCCRYAIRALQFNILVLVVGCGEVVGVATAYVVKYKDLTGIDDVTLSWSFYVAAASGVCFLVAIVLTVCETANAKRRQNYQPILPTSMS